MNLLLQSGRHHEVPPRRAEEKRVSPRFGRTYPAPPPKV